MFEAIKRLFERGECDIRIKSICIPEKCKVGVPVKFHARVINYGTRSGEYLVNAIVSNSVPGIEQQITGSLSPGHERLAQFAAQVAEPGYHKVKVQLVAKRKYYRTGNIEAVSPGAEIAQSANK